MAMNDLCQKCQMRWSWHAISGTGDNATYICPIPQTFCKVCLKDARGYEFCSFACFQRRLAFGTLGSDFKPDTGQEEGVYVFTCCECLKLSQGYKGQVACDDCVAIKAALLDHPATVSDGYCSVCGGCNRPECGAIHLRGHCACPAPARLTCANCGGSFYDLALHAECCPRMPTKPEPTLQLLVIDLSDCCVVKVEYGPFNLEMNDVPLFPVMVKGDSRLFYKPFTELRAAIDALDGEQAEPYPRIERMVDNGSGKLYYDIYGERGYLSPITDSQYEAISAVVGHPLPVYEAKKGGEWVQMFPPDLSTFIGSNDGIEDILQWVSLVSDLKVQIWRYTK